jgi:DNA-binding NarL/FixJ family response regulator
LVAVGKNIRLIIASSVRLVRESLAANFQGREDVSVVAVVDLSAQGIAQITAAEADVVLVDVSQAETVVAVARLIKPACPAVKLVAFALDETVDQVFACAAASFSGYVPRESSGEEVHRAVVDAVEGRMHCAPQIAAAMFSRLAGVLRELGPHGSLPAMTSRENEILALAAQGSSNKEIARQLAISSATVKNHMHNILQKLHVRRRAQATALMNSSRGS